MSETTIKPGKGPVPHKSIVVGYSVNAEEVDPDSEECFAKKSNMTNGRTAYYVKTNAKHEIYDPYNLEHTSALERIARRTGNPAYSFTEINEDGFNYYVQYLKNNGKALYRRASRELSHG